MTVSQLETVGAGLTKQTEALALAAETAKAKIADVTDAYASAAS